MVNVLKKYSPKRWTDIVRLLALVGGPGGGTDERDRLFFNPEKYKVPLY